MLFISKGKLSHEVHPKEVNGNLWLIDQDNLTDIKGHFIQGFCSDATIYSSNIHIVKGINVRIDEKGQVLLGGKEAKQLIGQNIQFQGGYRGYIRFGYGTIYYDENRKDYQEYGIWYGAKREGKFIKQHYLLSGSVYSIIFYSQFGWKETKLEFKQQNFYKIQQNSYDNLNSSEIIQRQQYQRLINQIEEYREQMQNKFKNEDFIRPILKYNIEHRQISNSLEPDRKLSYQQCQVYLNYLFHQQKHQTIKKSVIMSIHFIDLLHTITTKTINVQAYEDQIDRLLNKFNGQYALFGGLWDQIIFPLVLEGVKDHYSFAVYNFKQNRCTYYDSIRYFDPNLYPPLITLFLAKQFKKQKKRGQKMLDSIEFVQSDDMPKQFDTVSCGFYMLEGISQLTKTGTVSFQNNQLPQIKSKILQKLEEISSNSNIQKSV